MSNASPLPLPSRSLSPSRRLTLLGSVCRAALLAAPPMVALGVAMPGGAQAATTLSGSYGTTQYLANSESGNPFQVTGTIDTTGTTTNALSGDTSNSWTVSNTGTIRGGGYGITLYHTTSTVTNSGTVYGKNQGGIYIQGAGAVVSNSGTITGHTWDGIDINGDGAVYNASTGTISGDLGAAIGIYHGAGTVTNYGRLSSSEFDGVYLGQGGLVTNTGTIIGSRYGIEIEGASATVSNSGSITAGSDGIRLDNGGAVYNASTGTISGGLDAIGIFGGAGTVTNNGHLSGEYGIFMGQGGLVTNTGTIIGSRYGIEIDGAPGSVVNSGSIYGGSIGTVSDYRPAGVYLARGGAVTNNSGGTIGGLYNGVRIAGAPGTVANSGLIYGNEGAGISLLNGGMVVNYAGGTITGHQSGVYVTGGPGLVENSGKIAAYGSLSVGVDMRYGGTVANYGSSAQITGSYRGVQITGAPGIVTNSGTIEATGIYGGAAGVYLGKGGTVNNSGLISTNYGYGVQVKGAPGLVVNSGTITSGNGFEEGIGVDLENGGTVINSGTSALIWGVRDGVRIAGAPGYVYNRGTIFGAEGGGVYLENGGTVVNAGSAALIYGRESGVAIYSGVGTVVNSGTIIGQFETGVYLGNGGTVVNNGSNALISGGEGGVIISGSAGIVINSGTITTTSTEGGPLAGVWLRDGGYVGNSGLIQGYHYGVLIAEGSGLGTVINTGTIRSLSTAEGGGVEMMGGLVENNGSTALIQGYNVGVGIYGSLGGTVLNSGTIEATSTTDGRFSRGVVIYGPGFVQNTGTAALIQGSYVGVGIYGNGTVLNSGTIRSTGTARYATGVYIAGGGLVQNTGTAALISGNYAGVYIAGGPGTVINSGTIIGTGTMAPVLASQGTSGYSGSTGVKLTGGGYVGNSGLIQGYTGVYVSGGRGTVVNTGTIIGTGQEYTAGVRLTGGGLVTNGTAGLISGNYGVLIGGGVGTVINAGTILGTGTDRAAVSLYAGGSVINSGMISGGKAGVWVLDAPGYVWNSGSIASTTGAEGSTGVYMNNGGKVVNTGSGVITGYSGVVILGGPGTVVNYGRIASTATTSFEGAGVYLGGGGTVLNAGSITGYTGVAIRGGAGVVDNAGYILASGTGNTGVGVYFGVEGSTLVNSGTIIGKGGYSVEFTGSNNLLTLKTGSTLVGTAIGGYGTNDNILLLGSGTANNNFYGFTDLTMNGQNWVLGGTVAAYNSTSIVNGRLEVDGGLISANVTVANTGNLGGNGTIFGNVINSGTLTPGGAGFSIGTLTVSGGNYTQNGGEYIVDVDSTSSDQLNVVSTGTGTGTVSGTGGNLAVNAKVGDSYGLTTVYTIVQTTGTVTATAGSYTVTHNLPFLVPTVDITSQDILLTLNRTFGSNLITGETPNENAVGTGLDNAGGGGGAAFQAALAKLAGLDPPQAFNALDQLGGETYADFATANIQSFEMFSDALMQEMQMAHGNIGGTLLASQGGNRIQLASTDPWQTAQVPGVVGSGAATPAYGPWSVWVAGFGTGGNLSGDGNSHTLNYMSGGGGFGADYRFNPALVAGAAFGYANTNLSADNLPGQGNVDSYQFALYASYAPSQWYLDGLIGYTYNSESLQRSAAFGGTTATMNGDFNSNQFIFAAETGYGYKVAPALTLTPFLRAEVTTVGQNAFDESGTSALNLSVNSQSTTEARTILGGQLDTNFNVGLARPVDVEVRAGWAHELADVDRPITASFASAAGSAFTVQGAEMPRDYAVVGAGVSVPVWQQASLFLRYDGYIGDGFVAHAATGGVRINFGAPPPPMPPVPATVPAAAPAAAPAVQAPTFIVFFDFNKSTLTPEGAKVVDAAVAAAKQGQAARIQVTGYTDTVGTVQYNLALSERRARTVHDYMVLHGIPDREIAVKGMGKENLRVPTADGVREAQNRRVEIVE